MPEAERNYRDTADRQGLIRTLNNRATSLMTSGRWSEAVPLLCEVVQLCREANDDYALPAGLGNLGGVCRALGKAEEARKCHEEEEQICRRLHLEPDLAKSLASHGGREGGARAREHWRARSCIQA